MTRLIKYKAWDKAKKRMGKVLQLSLDDDGVIGALIDFGENVATQLIYPDEFELIEFTGLLDKNKEETYKGDLVEITCFGKVTEIGEMVFDEKKGRFVWRDPAGTLWGLETNDEANEIIGNIYENPELLEDNP